MVQCPTCRSIQITSLSHYINLLYMSTIFSTNLSNASSIMSICSSLSGYFSDHLCLVICHQLNLLQDIIDWSCGLDINTYLVHCLQYHVLVNLVIKLLNKWFEFHPGSVILIIKLLYILSLDAIFYHLLLKCGLRSVF